MPEDGKVLMLSGGLALTRAALLSFVNSAVFFTPNPRSASAPEFFKALTLALANGRDLVLNPSDGGDEKAVLDNPARFADFESLLRAVKNSPSRVELLTSGTEGGAKAFSHAVSAIISRLRLSADGDGQRWAFCYEPAHMAGLQVLLQILLSGASAVDLFGRSRAEVLAALEEFGVTHISATPTFYRLLLGSEKAFPRVRRATLGGERADAALLKNLEQMFPNAKINNIYASTEFGSLLVSRGEWFEIPKNLDGLVKIENGELLVSRALLGVASSEGVGEFFHTGDFVEFSDADPRRFKFVGRKSGFVNVGGYRVSLDEVEDALRTLPYAADASAFARPNSVLGNVVCCEICLRRGAGADAARVRLDLAKSLPQYKIPRKIEFVSALKTTRTGKAKRL